MFGYYKKSVYLCTRNNYQQGNEKSSTNYHFHYDGLGCEGPKRQTIQHRQWSIEQFRGRHIPRPRRIPVDSHPQRTQPL